MTAWSSSADEEEGGEKYHLQEDELRKQSWGAGLMLMKQASFRFLLIKYIMLWIIRHFLNWFHSQTSIMVSSVLLLLFHSAFYCTHTSSLQRSGLLVASSVGLSLILNEKHFQPVLRLFLISPHVFEAVLTVCTLVIFVSLHLFFTYLRLLFVCLWSFHVHFFFF